MGQPSSEANFSALRKDSAGSTKDHGFCTGRYSRIRTENGADFSFSGAKPATLPVPILLSPLYASGLHDDPVEELWLPVAAGFSLGVHEVEEEEGGDGARVLPGQRDAGGVAAEGEDVALRG